jgi:predicted transcriptional regulator
MHNRPLHFFAAPLRLAALVALVTTFAVRANAEPSAGGVLPSFTAQDLEGHARAGAELRGRRTLLIAISGASAGDAAARWLAAIRARAPGAEQAVVTLVALRLSWFVPDFVVQDRARASAERARWSRVWLNRDGALQSSLGLPDGAGLPLVVVVDEHGRVVWCRRAAPDAAPVNEACAALSPQATP